MEEGQGELIDGISDIFLEKYLEEYRQIPSKMRQYQDSDFRKSLTPAELKVFESSTMDEKRKGLENDALAKAVAYAIVSAHGMLD